MQDEDWLSRRYYGGDLPVEAERSLHEAAAHFGEPAVAEAHLKRAWDQAPGHMAVSIGAYKFYLYHHRLAEALPYARHCRRLAAQDLGIAENWVDVGPLDAAFDGLDEKARLYLFCLMAEGYLEVRLGQIEDGRRALAHLLVLDPGDKLGVAGLLSIIDRPDDDAS